jgi:hypothetical protein
LPSGRASRRARAEAAPLEPVEWVGTGQHVYISSSGAAAAASRAEALVEQARERGEHLWIAAVAFIVRPPVADSAMLDSENMLGYPGIGCFICERSYDDGDERTRCPGLSP